ASSVNFGTVSQGGSTSSLTFTVKNDGNQAMTLSGLSVPSGYSITNNLVASLAIGASDTFTVQLDTATTGTKTGNISFTTNDTGHNPFNFPITGTVSAPTTPN